MARLSLEERLNRIEDKISEKAFRENKGLGNEVGYYVFDYDPRAELDVRNHIAYLKNRINNGNKDFKIIEFDLFHTMIQVLEEEGYLEAFFDLEKDNGFFDMADSLVEALGLDETKRTKPDYLKDSTGRSDRQRDFFDRCRKMPSDYFQS